MVGDRGPLRLPMTFKREGHGKRMNWGVGRRWASDIQTWFRELLGQWDPKFPNQETSEALGCKGCLIFDF